MTPEAATQNMIPASIPLKEHAKAKVIVARPFIVLPSTFNVESFRSLVRVA